MKAGAAVLGLAAVLLAGGCASQKAAAPTLARERITCPVGQTRGVNVELVFGRNVGGKLGVSDADWKSFVDEDITPRYPDGFSVMDVQGLWRASNGRMVNEPSKVLYLVLDGGPDDPAKIEHIREAYKRRFRQDAVLMVAHQVCYAF